MKTIRKFQIFALVLVVSLAISCSQGNQTVYGSFNAIISSSANTKTILPSEIPNADKYIFSFKLTDSENGGIEKELTLSENGSYLIEDIVPGTYMVTVYGYSGETAISVGVIDSVTIQANQTTTKTVQMSLVSEGNYTGSVSATFDMTKVMDNPNIVKAMEGAGVKFVLEYTVGDEVIKEESEPTKESHYTFIVNDIPVSLDYFFTYSLVTYDDIVLIPDLVSEHAEIYSGITSTIRGEKDSVVPVTADLIADVLNVYDVTWFTSDASTVTVNWHNRFSSTQGCLFEEVKVALWSGEGEPDTEDYQTGILKGETGSCEFTELEQNVDYKVYFIVETTDGLKSSPYLFPDITINTKVPVESVKINDTALPDVINIGTSFELSAQVNPDNATNQIINWSVDKPEIIEFNDETDTFTAKAVGTAIITATSDDNSDATDDTPVVVKLTAPNSVTATLNSSDITVTWDEVTGAVKYEVYRSEGSDFRSIGKTTDTASSYTDTTIKASTDYRYKVVALAGNSAYDSGKSPESNLVSVEDSFITITPPDLGDYGDYNISFESDKELYFLEDDTEPIEVTAVSDVPGPTSYRWRINGDIVPGNNTDTISITRNDGVYKNNKLTVEITSSTGRTYSNSTSFQIITGTLKTIDSISVEGGSTTLTYSNVPEQNMKQLTANFSSEGSIIPDIEWSSLNPEIATVDEDGVVTPVAKGEAVIRVTSPATGKYMEITLTVVVPTASVSITEPEREYLIISGDRAGVALEDAGTVLLSLQLSATATGIDGVEGGQTDPIVWTSSNTAAVTVDSSTGLLSAGTQSGVSTITATSGNQSDTYTVYVLQPDILLNDNPVTGTTQTVEGWAWSKPYSLKLRFSYNENETIKEYQRFSESNWSSSGLYNYWCFNNDIKDQYEGTSGISLSIETNDYSGTLSRAAVRGEYRVYGVIIDKSTIENENPTRILTLSFTADW